MIVGTSPGSGRRRSSSAALGAITSPRRPLRSSQTSLGAEAVERHELTYLAPVGALALDYGARAAPVLARTRLAARRGAFAAEAMCAVGQPAAALEAADDQPSDRATRPQRGNVASAVVRRLQRRSRAERQLTARLCRVGARGRGGERQNSDCRHRSEKSSHDATLHEPLAA